MILTVSLKTFLTRKIRLPIFKAGEKYRVDSVESLAEAGGVNLSRTIRSFNEEVFLTGFFGGKTGDMILECLEKDRISSEYVTTKESNRERISILSDLGPLSIIEEKEASISALELDKFYKLYSELLARENIDLVTLTGELPQALSKETFEDLAYLARKAGKKLVLSLRADYLAPMIKDQAYLIVTSKEDLEDIFKLKLSSLEDLLRLARSIKENKIDNLAIYCGGYKYIVLLGEEAYLLSYDAGDRKDDEDSRASFIGGYLVSDLRDYDLDYKLKISLACHVATSLDSSSGYIDMFTMKEVMKDIVLERIEID